MKGAADADATHRSPACRPHAYIDTDVGHVKVSGCLSFAITTLVYR